MQLRWKSLLLFGPLLALPASGSPPCRLAGPVTASSINAAIESCSAAGGGSVPLPSGRFRMDDTVWLRDGVMLGGRGPAATVLETAGSHGVHFYPDTHHAGLRNLGIDARDQIPGSHGVRIARGCHDIEIFRVEVRRAPSYGIGLQKRDEQPGFSRITIREVRIYDSGSDGIDIKAPNDLIVLDDVIVSRPGVLQSRKAAFDLRGAVSATNIHARDLDRDQVGVRVRFGSVSVSSFSVSGEGPTAIGIVVEQPYAVFSAGQLDVAIDTHSPFHPAWSQILPGGVLTHFAVGD